MARSRRNIKSTSRLWSWLSFIVFALVLSLLAFSIYKKQSPAKTLKVLFTREAPQDPLFGMPKTELIDLIKNKESQIREFQSEIEQLTSDDGFEKGLISTTSDALNLRSEPSLESDILFKIPNGSKISILYYDDEELILEGTSGKWCKIKYADMEGWVWGNYIEKL